MDTSPRKLSKRTSILKPAKQRIAMADISFEEPGEETKALRKVRFSHREVKGFFAESNNQTIWTQTYEENIHTNSSSSQAEMELSDNVTNKSMYFESVDDLNDCDFSLSSKLSSTALPETMEASCLNEMAKFLSPVEKDDPKNDNKSKRLFSVESNGDGSPNWDLIVFKNRKSSLGACSILGDRSTHQFPRVFDASYVENHKTDQENVFLNENTNVGTVDNSFTGRMEVSQQENQIVNDNVFEPPIVSTHIENNEIDCDMDIDTTLNFSTGNCIENQKFEVENLSIKTAVNDLQIENPIEKAAYPEVTKHFNNEVGALELTKQISQQIIKENNQQVDEDTNLRSDRRKTIVFNSEEGEMEFTEQIPQQLHQNNLLQESPDISLGAEEKTIVFEHEEGVMVLTEQVPQQFIQENVPQENQNLNLRADRGRTVVFNSEDGEMELTEQIPQQFLPKNLRQENVDTNLRTDRRRTIVFNHEEGAMEFTAQIPPQLILIQEKKPHEGQDLNLSSDKRKTFDFNNKENEMKLTEQIGQKNLQQESQDKNLGAERRRTIVFNNDEGAMEFTEQVPQQLIQENKQPEGQGKNFGAERRRTIVFNQEEGAMEFTEQVPQQLIQENKQPEDQDPNLRASRGNTDVFNNEKVAKGVSGQIPRHLIQENIQQEGQSTNLRTDRRKTIAFNNDEGEMDLTEQIPQQYLKENIHQKDQFRNLQADVRKHFVNNNKGAEMAVMTLQPQTPVQVEVLKENLPADLRVDREKSIVFNNGGAEMGLSEKNPQENFPENVRAEKRHNTAFDNRIKDVEMTESPQKVPVENVRVDQRKTLFFNNAGAEMELTESLPQVLVQETNKNQHRNVSGNLLVDQRKPMSISKGSAKELTESAREKPRIPLISITHYEKTEIPDKLINKSSIKIEEAATKNQKPATLKRNDTVNQSKQQPQVLPVDMVSNISKNIPVANLQRTIYGESFYLNREKTPVKTSVLKTRIPVISPKPESTLKNNVWGKGDRSIKIADEKNVSPKREKEFKRDHLVDNLNQYKKENKITKNSVEINDMEVVTEVSNTEINNLENIQNVRMNEIKKCNIEYELKSLSPEPLNLVTVNERTPLRYPLEPVVVNSENRRHKSPFNSCLAEYPRGQQDQKLRAKEEQKLRFQEDQKLRLQEEQKLRLQEDQMLRAQEEQKLRLQEDQMLRAQEEQKLRLLEGQMLRAREEQMLKLQEEQKLRAQEEQKLKLQEEQKLRLQEEQMLRAQEEQKLKLQEEQRLRFQEEQMLRGQEEQKLKTPEVKESAQMPISVITALSVPLFAKECLTTPTQPSTSQQHPGSSIRNSNFDVQVEQFCSEKRKSNLLTPLAVDSKRFRNRMFKSPSQEYFKKNFSDKIENNIASDLSKLKIAKEKGCRRSPNLEAVAAMDNQMELEQMEETSIQCNRTQGFVRSANEMHKYRASQLIDNFEISLVENDVDFLEEYGGGARLVDDDNVSEDDQYEARLKEIELLQIEASEAIAESAELLDFSSSEESEFDPAELREYQLKKQLEEENKQLDMLIDSCKAKLERKMSAARSQLYQQQMKFIADVQMKKELMPKSFQEEILEKAEDNEAYKIKFLNENSIELLILFKSIEVAAEIDVCGVVSNITLTKLKPSEKPDYYALYLEEFCLHKLHPSSISSAIGATFNVLSLLDYIELLHGELKTLLNNWLYVRLRTTYIEMNKDFLIRYSFVSWNTRTDMDIELQLAFNSNNFHSDVTLRLVPGKLMKSTKKENAIRKLFEQTPKNVSFLRNFIMEATKLLKNV